MIYFTKHAKEKFEVLKRHGFSVSKSEVIETVNASEVVDESHRPLLIAQRKIDKDHVLRVVYKEEDRAIKIITFYPGKLKKYE